MSARDKIMDLVFKGVTRGAYEGLCDEVRAAMDEYRTEIQREAAARIREELPERVKKLTGNWAEIRTVSTAQHAADLIDPDKP